MYLKSKEDSGQFAAPPLLNAERVNRIDPVKGTLLLHAFSLVINGGDQIVLTGMTGSGKSLLLRSLIMIDPIGDGTIYFKGEKVAGHGIPAFRANVAYVRQRPAMIADSVEQNLRLPYTLDIHAGKQYSRDEAVRLLDALGQPVDFLAKRSRDLSGGEAQLVALVRALLLAPTILLLDEPTAALDDDTTAAVESLLRSWAETAASTKALVLVTHSHDQARRLGRRHLQIREGRLQPESGAPFEDGRDAAARQETP